MEIGKLLFDSWLPLGLSAAVIGITLTSWFKNLSTAQHAGLGLGICILLIPILKADKIVFGSLTLERTIEKKSQEKTQPIALAADANAAVIAQLSKRVDVVENYAAYNARSDKSDRASYQALLAAINERKGLYNAAVPPAQKALALSAESAGLPIEWDSRMGPIKFEFSKVLAKEEYDRTETFRFSTSTRF